MRRKTRFVCVSDTHAYTPSEAGFKLPAGDVLIHAGDLTNHGSSAELRKTMSWIATAEFEVKIIICGNHDITLDPGFYAEYGSRFHGQHLEDTQKCIEIVTQASPSIVYLRHQSALVRLTRPNGPNTVFKIFGSPYSQSPGTWAYGYESSDSAALWNIIPLDTDIIVTHTPPYSHCDSRTEGISVGCKALRSTLSKVRPLLAICGHVHESRGSERVRWHPRAASAAAAAAIVDEPSQEDEIIRDILPPSGSRKQSLVDLTGKKAPKLDNDHFAINNIRTPISRLFEPSQNVLLLPSSERSLERLQSSGAEQPTSSSLSSCLKDIQSSDKDGLYPQRRETCIVNAAIMATSWPHRGGKRFHAPIVVDLELPVWNEEKEGTASRGLSIVPHPFAPESSG
ncbi:metallophosphatase domain-containing protein [Aspergillus ibericus CBS 121593]|uniref:Ser/Thr protein phosphatase family protein n=1 Tax=Aspergillus ibericus CBS 121593 TaxID=1448316 RepID=A0A395HG80_9EURO|nr:Ser/Thr protein phosphatase family protein [Aspergillus ibericus CBS 121593]RAL06135.1 Ser/Thr protein phosphatase family protein [Aspergillus ibericus CBS 121593]